MKRIMVACSALFLPCFLTALYADDAPKTKKRLLLITESRGFRHSCVTRKVTTTMTVAGKPVQSLEGLDLKVGKDGKLTASYDGRAETVEVQVKVEPCVVEKAFAEMAAKHGFFEVVSSQNSRKEITEDNLKNFDAVFFFTTGELPLSEVQKADLLSFIRSGKGFGGSHCAADTFYQWKEYGDLIGAYFAGHPPGFQKIRVIVEDQKHPATRHLGEGFNIEDEIYKYKAYSREKVRVLLSMDMKASGKNLWREDGDNPLAWVREYGKGRVFYTAFGHREEVWADPRFQQHVIGGLRYIFGLEQADATPSAAARKQSHP